jgi:TolA-binding protein
MIQVDHPEELLDRIASRTASPDEVRKFEEHASQCAACAAHLSIQPLVRNALQPSLEDRMSNERAISRAMASLPGGARRRAPRTAWFLAAAALLITGVAGARFWSRVRSLPPTDAVDSAPATAAKATPREPTNPPPALPENPGEGTESVMTDPTPVHAQPSLEPRETAAQVFAEANELRRTGKDPQAMVTYRKVERLFPGTAEAQQSHATLGSLLMDHGNPQDALGQFDRYIEHGGPLLVDVLAGKATALQKLGRAAEERYTWETLLARFPKSVQATRAKTRLAELH